LRKLAARIADELESGEKSESGPGCVKTPNRHPGKLTVLIREIRFSGFRGEPEAF
jgi:hypothetical protein